MEHRLDRYVNPKDLIADAMAHIEAHPEEWEQATWISSCGTKACLAGRMALLDGKTHEWFELDKSDDVGDWAADVLGVDRVTADFLFDGTNPMSVLRAGVKAYLNDEDIAAAVRAAREEEEPPCPCGEVHP